MQLADLVFNKKECQIDIDLKLKSDRLVASTRRKDREIVQYNVMRIGLVMEKFSVRPKAVTATAVNAVGVYAPR